MKTLAITALVALIVSLPFVLRRHRVIGVSPLQGKKPLVPDQNYLYDTEDFIM